MVGSPEFLEITRKTDTCICISSFHSLYIATREIIRRENNNTANPNLNLNQRQDQKETQNVLNWIMKPKTQRSSCKVCSVGESKLDPNVADRITYLNFFRCLQLKKPSASAVFLYPTGNDTQH